MGGPQGHHYNPDEPRDWRGRWTASGNGGRIIPEVAYRQTPLLPMGRAAARRGLLHPGTFGFRPASRMYGGQIIRIQDGPGSGIGGNGPPPEPVELPEAEASIDAPRVPQGWDTPGYVSGGFQHPTVRRPVRPDGTPWPIADHDHIKTILAPRRRGMAELEIFVPVDGIGPMLMGSATTRDFPKPNGYDLVTFYGTPQVNKTGGVENAHADDGIQEALALAKTNRYSAMYFNRSLSTITGGGIKFHVRPDLVAVTRPEIDDIIRLKPYESFSNGQSEQERQYQMPNLSSVDRIYGRSPPDWKKSPNKK